MNAFNQAILKRRSRYELSRETTMTDSELQARLAETLKHMPSPYHAQHQRMVLLLGEKHDALWDIVLATLKKRITPEKFKKTKEKIAGFKHAYGTVLFFDDWPTIEALQAKFPKAKEKWELWANQSQGMAQFAVWTMLADAGLGASLQHYNPIIDDEVEATFKVPKGWRLAAQMPFGKPTGSPKDKTFKPIEERFLIRK